MDRSRLGQSPTVYVLGMIALVLSIGMFLFGAYLVPNLLLGVKYAIPEFVAHLRHWLHLEYQLTDSEAEFYIVLGFFSVGALSAILAYKASNHIDNKLYLEKEIQPDESENSENMNSNDEKTVSLTIKIIIWILVAIMVVSLLEWLIYIPPVE